MEPNTEAPSVSQFIRSYPFRLLLFAGLTAVLFQLIYLGIESQGPTIMAVENGPMEAVQILLAAIAAVGIFLTARWTSKGRAIMLIAGSMVVYAAAREADATFEAWLFDDAYKWVVGLPLTLICIRAVVAQRRRLMADVMWWTQQPATTLFVIAGIFLCFVCQNLDRSQLWFGLQNSIHLQVNKALVEEYAEVFAYLLLAFSGIEAAITAHPLCEFNGAVQRTGADQRAAWFARVPRWTPSLLSLGKSR